MPSIGSKVNDSKKGISILDANDFYKEKTKKGVVIYFNECIRAGIWRLIEK